LLILLRESIARSGQFVPSQTRRFAKSRALASPAEVAACARETSNEQRRPIIYVFAALCFSEFRKPVLKSLLMPERRPWPLLLPLGAAELTKCFPAFIA
jgi:hypothetical protein